MFRTIRKRSKESKVLIFRAIRKLSIYVESYDREFALLINSRYRT